MKPFRYLHDPLFLACVFAYLANRWLIRSVVDDGFWHSHFNDLICIPFWTPALVWLARRLGWRNHDGRPRGVELLLPVVVWSVMFEIWLPQTALFRGRSTADPQDVLWYVAGALAASVWWDWWYGEAANRPAGVADPAQNTI